VGSAAPVIPANTTTCTLDADGCLVGADATCVTVLDAPLTGDQGTVQVDGTLLDSVTPREIAIWGFAKDTGYEPYGYQAKVGEAPSFGGYGNLIGIGGVGAGSNTWSYVTGDVPVSATAEFNKASTSASLTVRTQGAPTTPVSSSSMGVPDSDKVIVTLWHAKACNIVVTQP